MIKAYIGIGSNLGNKKNNCVNAIRLIADLPSTSVPIISSFYKTEPVMVIEGDWFLNCVILLYTELPPLILLDHIKNIELKLGRVRSVSVRIPLEELDNSKDKYYESRKIDLDILFYDNLIINSFELIIPHPQIHLRRFVLVPMAEIAPDFIHPVIGKNISHILSETKDIHQVKNFKDE